MQQATATAEWVVAVLSAPPIFSQVTGKLTGAPFTPRIPAGNAACYYPYDSAVYSRRGCS
jgi:hypothetical protein